MTVSSDDPYAQIAEFYDVDHGDLHDDVAMYMQFVESAGDPVLELACGTGRILIPLAEAGFRAIGADVSPAMLARAREKVEHRDFAGRLTLLEANMLDAHTIEGGPFGVVIMALDSLSHVQTQEQQLAALRSAHQALDPRGVLLIDVIHASPSRLHTLDGTIGTDGRWELDNGETVERFSTHSVFPATQAIETRIWFDVTEPGGNLRRVSTSMTQRYVSPGELRLMLSQAGFQDMMLYGGYELDSFEDGSDRLIVAAEATKTA